MSQFDLEESLRQREINRIKEELAGARHDAIASRLDEVIRLLRELCEGQHITVKL